MGKRDASGDGGSTALSLPSPAGRRHPCHPRHLPRGPAILLSSQVTLPPARDIQLFFFVRKTQGMSICARPFVSLQQNNGAEWGMGGGESRPRWPEKVSLAGIPDAQVLEGACQLPSWLRLPSPPPSGLCVSSCLSGRGWAVSPAAHPAAPDPDPPTPAPTPRKPAPPPSFYLYVFIYLFSYLFWKGPTLLFS